MANAGTTGMTAGAGTGGPLKLRTILDDRGEVLEVSGELDIATVPQFDAAVELLVSTPRDRAVVRMADVTFIDSSGLGALLRAHRIGEAHGVPLAIQDPSQHVRSLITLTALDATLRLDPPSV
jgi:anti-anti-sigma factor